MRIALLLTASFALASCATTDTNVATAPSERSIEADVRYLASDELEGREAGQPGYQRASQYMADRFASIGVQPGAADGTYFQPVGLRIMRPGPMDRNTMVLSGDKAVKLELGTDYLVDGMIGLESGVIEAPLVFVGQGFVDPRNGRDDFAGVDLKGKIAVAITGAPEFLNTEERAYFNGQRSREMADRGAVGMISLLTEKSEERYGWDKRVENRDKSTSATWIGEDGKAYDPREGMVASAVLNPAAAAKLLEGQPISYADAIAAIDTPGATLPAFDMGITAKIAFEQKFETATSRNVVGVVPGTDPELKDEYVVLTAHLDHIGVDEGKEGDKINNGAMDNATGSAIMIDVARRFAMAPPRRSLMFVALTAEEMGLIGSSYHARNTIVPRNDVVANVNLDMPMLTYEFTDVVAFGAERSTLYGAVARAAKAAGVDFAEDPFPEEGLFTRSDHYSYVRQGIPAIYVEPGPGNGGLEAFGAFLGEHYHQPSDEVGLILFDQAARFADLNFDIARNIADMDERPVWKKDDFFGTVFDGPMKD